MTIHDTVGFSNTAHQFHKTTQAPENDIYSESKYNEHIWLFHILVDFGGGHIFQNSNTLTLPVSETGVPTGPLKIFSLPKSE